MKNMLWKKKWLFFSIVLFLSCSYFGSQYQATDYINSHAKRLTVLGHIQMKTAYLRCVSTCTFTFENSSIKRQYKLSPGVICSLLCEKELLETKNPSKFVKKYIR